ncbi:MAG TPA: hypothetical protein VK642_03465 [Burkholderiales bacterium]|nr:hypothetical protein [Burkholderiales bacterium]
MDTTAATTPIANSDAERLSMGRTLNIGRMLHQLHQLCVLIDTLALAMPSKNAPDISCEMLGGVFGLIGDALQSVRDDLAECIVTDRGRAEPTPG